jgi:hypothetical protein
MLRRNHEVRSNGSSIHRKFCNVVRRDRSMEQRSRNRSLELELHNRHSLVQRFRNHSLVLHRSHSSVL